MLGFCEIDKERRMDNLGRGRKTIVADHSNLLALLAEKLEAKVSYATTYAIAAEVKTLMGSYKPTTRKLNKRKSKTNVPTPTTQ
jgi:hypothetical protein